MKKACVGSMDKSPPKEIVWETFPHRLFFGRESTVTWGVGGVAFTNPLTNLNDQTHMCLYRITLSDFISVSVSLSIFKSFGDLFCLFTMVVSLCTGLSSSMTFCFRKIL